MDTDILIIGAGLAGAATAYHLRKLGLRQIILLEREAFAGGHSSGRNAAMVRSQVSDPDLEPMVREGAEILGTGRLARYRRTGGFLVGQGPDDAADHLPLARGTGRWYPGDGVINVSGLLQRLLARQNVIFDAPATRIHRDRSPLRVVTPRGDFNARIVVNAAGPWAGRIGDLPLTPANRHLFLTSPRRDLDPDWPWVWDETEGLYFRPEGRALLLCPCDDTPADPGDYREDRAAPGILRERMQRRQPDLAEFSIANQWVGQRTFAADHRFVIGFDPRDRRLFHVAALGGHGVTCAMSVGRLAGELIAGAEDAQAGAFDPARLL